MTKLQKKLIKLLLGNILLAILTGLGLFLAGVDVLKILGGLSLGGIAVAFIIKDSLASMGAAFTIAFGKLYDVGDWLELGNKKGWVNDITFNYTYVTLRKGETETLYLTAIPNSDILKKGYITLAQDPFEEEYDPFHEWLDEKYGREYED